MYSFRQVRNDCPPRKVTIHNNIYCVSNSRQFSSTIRYGLDGVYGQRTISTRQTCILYYNIIIHSRILSIRLRVVVLVVVVCYNIIIIRLLLLYLYAI